MTPGEWIGWSAVALGFLGVLVFCWAQGSDLDHLRGRVDLLEEQRGNLQADLSEGLDAINTRMDSLHAPEPKEPTTQPIQRVPTDTVDQAAAIDAGLRRLHGATASGGRHRMPR